MKSQAEKQAIGFGVRGLDVALAGGLARGRVHEFFAAQPSDALAAMAVGLGLAVRTAGTGGVPQIVWVRQDYASLEMGRPYAPGLAAYGFDPSRFVMVRAKDGLSALKAGVEAARCGGLSALVLDLWGEPRGLDLTASRRLFLAAKQSGVTVFMLRVAAKPSPSAAETRWQVRALPSQPGLARAPGPPRFELTLLRNRSLGAELVTWRVEWNRERQCFAIPTFTDPAPAPLSRPVVSHPANRPAGVQQRAGGRAG
jgi:protein ImuA